MVITVTKDIGRHLNGCLVRIQPSSISLLLTLVRCMGDSCYPINRWTCYANDIANYHPRNKMTGKHIPSGETLDNLVPLVGRSQHEVPLSPITIYCLVTFMHVLLTSYLLNCLDICNWNTFRLIWLVNKVVKRYYKRCKKVQNKCEISNPSNSWWIGCWYFTVQ